MKLIDYHKKWMEQGYMEYPGLCENMSTYPDLRKYIESVTFMSPLIWKEGNINDELTLIAEGLPTLFWGRGMTLGEFSEIYFGKLPRMKHKEVAYTPLRQTIVLFICAMHDEL